MKKIIITMSVLAMMISCTAEDFALWNEAQRERRERGQKCVYNQYGNIVCGFKSPPRN